MAPRKFTADQLPLLDRFNKCININKIFFFLYIALFGWGVASFLLIPIHANIEWPIALALVYNITIFVVHFGIIAIGTTLVPNFVYYPVRPWELYVLVDGVMFFVLVGVVASYLLSSISSVVPLVGTWLLLGALCINIWKLYELGWGSASKVGTALYSSGV